MVVSLVARVAGANLARRSVVVQQSMQLTKRHKTHYRSGAIRPMPKILSFGFAGLIGSVVPGLLIGAAISKSVANFLEENDLFVPSDDDDDED